MPTFYHHYSDSINKLFNSCIKYISFSLVASSFLFLSTINAQDVLMSWEFNTYTGIEVKGTATTVNTNISSVSPSGEINRGVGLGSRNNQDRFNADQWVTTNGDISTLSYAIANDKFMEWTITPKAGYQITITSVVYNFAKSSTGPGSITLRSSLDAYASDLDSKTLIGDANDGLVSTISGVTNVASALSFRLYGYNASGSTGTGGFEGSGDDISIYGTVSEITDTDSEVGAPVTQVSGASILSSSNTLGSTADVFTFNIVDQGTLDLKPTRVTNIRLKPATSNTADWTDHIQGLTLDNGSPITIGTPDITDTYIDIPIASGSLDIGETTNSDVTLAVYLNATNIVDGKILSFKIDVSAHGFIADASGSQFESTFSGGEILSNDFPIDVQATQMQYIQQPVNVVANTVMTPSVTVAFTDANGNIDLSHATEQISISASGLTISGSSTTLQTVQSNGLATFNNLLFSTFGTGTLTASDATSSLSAPDIVSNSFEVTQILSVIQAVEDSETLLISSVINDETITAVSEGEQVWQLELFDGDGTNPDNDSKPTNYTGITITQHANNQISDWQSVMFAAGFFEGSVFIPGSVTINPTNILFIPGSPISIPDGAGSKRTISLRVSMLSPLPVGIEGSKLVFELSEGGVTVESATTSSQPGTFTESSSIGANAINIEASKLLFIQEPTDVDQDQTMIPSVTVAFTDVNGNIDVDYESSVIGVSANNVALLVGLVNEPIHSDGLSTFSALSFATSGTGTLTATDINNVLGTDAFVSSVNFEVFPGADHIVFVNAPNTGQINQILSPFTIEARRADETVDPYYNEDITISVHSGAGNISGTLTQTANSGIATFADIQVDASGFHALASNSGTLTQGISPIIAIVGQNESIFPNGQETMLTTVGTVTISDHDAATGFVNSGALSFNGGGATGEASIRNTSSSSGYSGASGGANAYFTSSAGEYGFAIEGIDASGHSNLTLQFAVRKQNAAGGDFASLAVEYWDGDSWEAIAISDYPTSAVGTGWHLLNPVALPGAAEIANLGLRWLKTGAIACRIDDVSLSGSPKIAPQLIVATINNGLAPVTGVPFDVDVAVQDGGGSPSNVLQDTDVQLTLNTGTGILGGNTTTTITAGTSSATVSGLTYSASETGVIFTAGRISGDDLQSGNSIAFSVLPAEPNTSASSIIIDVITTTSMNLNWTVGDGSERIVVVKQGASVDLAPVDATSYTANADVTLGEDIGNGNIVVYSGAGNSVSITNLQSNSFAYHFAIYEYNGSGSLENYKQTDPAMANKSAIGCNDPLVQASALTFSDIEQTTLDLFWTDGDGSGRIVFMNSTNTFVDPINGIDAYSADLNWNNAGQQAVYFSSGAGTSISISNLSHASTYYFRVYEYNCSGALIKYKTDVDNTTGVKTNSFTTGFPQSGSSRAGGFHLYANVTEPLTAYYLIKDKGDPVPSAPSDVVDGVGGVLNGNIIIDTQGLTYEEIITGLSASSGYDVYWVLNDGAGPTAINAVQSNIRASDMGANVNAPVSQVVSAIIPATTDLSTKAIDVFAFEINDNSAIGGDAEQTNVTKIWIRNSGATDWATVISGITLSGNTLGNIPITEIRVSSDSIVVDIAQDGLMISDQTSEIITMGVYLLSSGISDGATLQFEISEVNASHVFETSVYGSQFASPFAPSTITSNEHTIDVAGDRLKFNSYPAYPASSVDKNQDFSLSVEAIDANGNRDTGDNTTVVNLSRGMGTESIDQPTVTAMTNGLISWNDVKYSATKEFFTIIAAGGTLTSTSTGTMQVGNAIDLVVTTGSTLPITGTQIFDYVTIENGGSLDLAQGATLEIKEDLIINGTFNDLGGKTLFNGVNIQSIYSDEAGKTVSFYDIDIANAVPKGLVNEVNINLTNTLKLYAEASFDADGSAGLADFTLVSTSSSTARIAPIDDGALLSGNVVWQRSLRTGPAGNRNFGTPIQGQTLADISDDVYVQGVAELQPGEWENVYTYTEANGTIEELGLDGWTGFTSTANPVDPGIGVRIYLWEDDYATEQVISNRGLPNIGDGSGDVAVSGETFDFTLSHTDGAFDGGGWNFLANPYPCEVDWSLVSHSEISGSAVYIWNPNIQNYSTYNLVSDDTYRYISSGQGFFVKAASGSATLSFSESDKVTTHGNSFLKEAAKSFPVMTIKIISKQGKQDETAMAFTQFSTDDYDLEYDALKLSGGWVNLSTISSDGKLLAINAMGEKRGVQSVKLNIEPYEFGKYTMDFPTIKLFSDGTVMILKDKFLDKSLVIEPGSSYNFDLDKNNAATFGADRFELQFVEPVNLRFDQVQAEAGKDFIMPVYADQLTDVMSAQLALGWDESELTFVKIEDPGALNINDFDIKNVEIGSLSISSTYTTPLELPDDALLFSIRFKANNITGSTSLSFERSAMRFTAIDDIDMSFTSKDVTIDISALQNRTVAGTVTTFQGDVVDNVTVRIAGDFGLENTTDLSGGYSLSTTGNSGDIISASRSDDLKMNAGVTTADLITTRRHILGIEDFANPYQIVAADVNTSSSVTALDLVQMRKVILGINEGFSTGLNWLFIPDIYDLSIDPFNFETSLDISLLELDLSLDFVAVKVGDVNNSWISHGSARTSKSKILLSLEHPELKDKTIEIPVTASSFNEISGYQFSLTWDANLLDYHGIEHVALEGHFNENYTNEGLLTTLWDERNGQSINLKNETVLFKLKFSAIHDKATSLVQLNSALTQALAFDSQLNALSINSVSAHVNLEALQNGPLELYQNVPNPFERSTEISFRITEKGLAKLSIINLLGETVYRHEQRYEPGVHTISWNTNQGSRSAPPGVYLYRLESSGQELIKKMLIK